MKVTYAMASEAHVDRRIGIEFLPGVRLFG